jgi:D-alanyl-D-alanine carboxypeptidase/D-alanyl-D-alanine-endopeptidase (penicillin-binding protein 4)
LWHWVAAGAAVVALGAGSAAVTGASTPPATVTYVDGLDIGEKAPILGGLAANAPRPTINGVAASVGPFFADPALGSRVAGSIVDGLTGDNLFDQNSTEAMTPASTAKLLTAAAVLHTRGPNYRIPTRVVAGSSPGEVILVGAGDPTLASGPASRFRGAGRLDLLAEQVRKSLGSTPTRIFIDTSLYQGPTVHPTWSEADLHASYICPITALTIDGGRVDPVKGNSACHPQPDIAAGKKFGDLFGFSGVVEQRVAPEDAKVLGEVLSPPMASLVEMMLVDSENVVAEALARQAALAKILPGSFAGGAAATRAVLAELGVADSQVGLVDASGFSYANRVTAKQLTDLLVKVASPQHPQLRPIISGLPVAGFSGTLTRRDQGSGLGVVRAKTGTLNGVNSLAGFVVDKDGRLLAFAVVADITNNTPRAEGALDRLAAAIASCGCR